MADNEKTAEGEQSYGASDITVLEGLEAVRKRPGMYIGSTGERGLHHLVYEVVDNSVDEALAGYADHIEVTIQADGGIKVVDNGRGIPVDEHPTEHKPTVEVVMTILHAGGKFGGGGYAVSGGLHGVGISVVNALSTRVNTEIRRQGYVWRMSFANGGTPITPLERGEATDETGTTQVFYPDPEIFETVEFDFETLRQRFQQMAFLNKGLRITLTDERESATDEGDEIAGGEETSDKKTKGHRTVTYCYEHGLRDYVEYLDSAKKSDTINNEIIDFEADNDEGTMSVEIAMQWTTAYSSSVHTFANTINTTEGGMHEEGFRTALTSLVNRYGRDKGIIRDKDDNLTGDDVREGLTAVISIKLTEPQFEGQTKTKLGNTEARTFVAQQVYSKLTDWFDAHPADAKAIIAKGQAAQAPASPLARRVRPRAARASSNPPPCPASCATVPRARPPNVKSLSSRVTPQAAPPSAAATPSARPSCRSAARSSTSKRRAWTEPCPRTRSAPSSLPSGPASAKTSTSRSCATARSSSWRTPTSTASTLPRCC